MDAYLRMEQSNPRALEIFRRLGLAAGRIQMAHALNAACDRDAPVGSYGLLLLDLCAATIAKI
jgi:hypothetical protein